MIARYLEQFFRHRLAVAAPLFVALFGGTTIGLIQPHTYQATARLWFDQQAFAGSISSGSATPAEQGALVLNELIATDAFCVRVADSAQLRSYLSARASFSSDPISALSARLGLTAAGSGRPASNELVVAAVQKSVVTVTGPQILTVSFDSKSPEVSNGTVKALVDEFTMELTSARISRADYELRSIQSQVDAEAKAVDAADLASSGYLTAHPELKAPNSPADLSFTALRLAAEQEHQRYASLNQKLDQARIDAASGKQPGAIGLRIIDHPEGSAKSTSRLKPIGLAAGVGLAVGLLTMLAILALLVATDETVRSRRDLEQLFGDGNNVVGSVPLLHSRKGKARVFRPARAGRGEPLAGPGH